LGVGFLFEGFAGADACALQTGVSDAERAEGVLVGEDLFEQVWIEIREARGRHFQVVVGG